MKTSSIITNVAAVVTIVGIAILFVLTGGYELIESMLAPEHIYIVEYRSHGMLKKNFKLPQEVEAIRLNKNLEKNKGMEFLGYVLSQDGVYYNFHCYDSKNYILIRKSNHAVKYILPEKSIQALNSFLHEREMYIRKIEGEYNNQHPRE